MDKCVHLSSTVSWHTIYNIAEILQKLIHSIVREHLVAKKYTPYLKLHMSGHSLKMVNILVNVSK